MREDRLAEFLNKLNDLADDYELAVGGYQQEDEQLQLLMIEKEKKQKVGKWIKLFTKVRRNGLGVVSVVSDYKCSECGRVEIEINENVDILEEYPYCRCGAKMKEE